MMTCDWQDHLNYLHYVQFIRNRQSPPQRTDPRDIIAHLKRIEARQEQALSDLRTMIRNLEETP